MNEVAERDIQSRRAGIHALGCLLLVGSFLALSLVIAKLADESGAPRLSFLMTALIAAALILSGLTAARGQPMPVNRRTLEYAVVSGILFAIPNAVSFLSVRHVGAGFVALSLAFPVLVTWLLAVTLRMEQLRMLRLAGVLLGLAGGVVLALSKGSDAEGAYGWAALVMLMPVVLAFGNIYRTWRWPQNAAPVFLAAVMMLGGALALSPFALTLEAGRLSELFGSARVVMLLLAETAVFAVVYFFFFVLQRIAGPVYLSQIGLVAALVGTLIAILLLGEGLPPNFGVAGILIILGTIIFHRAA
ncbi:DMT family transporter [Pseudomonas sp. gcc21]|uniref:DMT family transporter n=1 Tax=Pseudomonas sp. gcc21 TaxID=2726989 RepID=UPI0014528BB2|nr:DMT family transporter [Pseudomonas sp. gcc21]QJD58043.1 DMT family transporter [Pseudomonas sp. gcc21]